MWPDYVVLKQIHVTTVGVTAALFLLRWAWALLDPARLQRRWVKVLPHVNDSLLLTAGLSMALILQQYPLVNGWLTAKLFALLLYIVLGSIAIKRGRTRQQKALSGILALGCLGYLVTVAFTRDPFPFL